jgi:hypothetical protein
MFRRPAIAFPSTVIGFQLDNLLYPDFRHQEHGAIRFAIAPAGLADPTPLRLLTGTSSPQNHPMGSEESADATGPVTCGTDPLAPDNTEFVQRARGSGWECLRT